MVNENFTDKSLVGNGRESFEETPPCSQVVLTTSGGTEKQSALTTGLTVSFRRRVNSIPSLSRRHLIKKDLEHATCYVPA